MVTLWGVGRRKGERAPYLQTLGKRIQAQRIEKGFKSREKFCEALGGISVTTIGNIERGENEPSLVTIVRIANALETTVDQLMSGLVLPPL